MTQYLISILIVALTGWALIILWRLFPSPKPYDWPEWGYRLYFALVHHGKGSWRSAR